MRNKPDPPAKWVLRDRLLGELYKPVEEQKSVEIRALILQNCAANQAQDIKDFGSIQEAHTHLSFAFNGEFFSLEGVGPPVRNRVYPNMLPVVRAHVEFYKQIDQECMLVKGYLDSVFSFSSSPGDWIRLLPDTLQPVLRANILYNPQAPELWEELRTPQECEAFIEKRRSGFNLIRQRLATNLISI